MKKSAIVFSLFTNAVLFFAILSPASISRIFPGSAKLASKTTAISNASADTGRSFTRKANSADPSSRTPMNWGEMKSEDPKTFVDNARAMGIPAELTRSLLQALLTDDSLVLRRKLEAVYPTAPYWKLQPLPPELAILADPKKSADLHELTLANTKLVNDLIGPDPNAFTSGSERLQFGNLPADKIAELKQINTDYDDLMLGVRFGNIILPEDRAKIAYFNQEKDKDIRALLTPEEYDEYLFRSSSTANSIRGSLTYFEPTEAEFRTIFALQQPVDQKYAVLIGGVTADFMRERTDAQNQLKEQIRAALDPERAALYDMTTDPAYRSAIQLTTRLSLPKENAAAVWQAQKDIQARATVIRADQTLSPNVVIEKLTALQSEANAAVGAALGGESGLESYKMSGGGWINSLVPRSAPARGGL